MAEKDRFESSTFDLDRTQNPNMLIKKIDKESSRLQEKVYMAHELEKINQRDSVSKILGVKQYQEIMKPSVRKFQRSNQSALAVVKDIEINPFAMLENHKANMASNPNRYKRSIDWLINGDNKTKESKDILDGYLNHQNINYIAKQLKEMDEVA